MINPSSLQHPQHEATGDTTGSRPGRGLSVGSVFLRQYRTNLDPVTSLDASLMDDEHVTQSADQPPAPFLQLSEPIARAMKSIASPPLPTLKTSDAYLNQSNGASTMIPPHRSMLRSLAMRSSQESLRQNMRPPNLLSTSKAPFASHFPQSPCFFHQRFEDAINVDRVREEIGADDDGMSHSSLMRTAISVREISKQLQRQSIKGAVRTVMIVTKARDNKLVYLTRELTEWLLSTPRYNSDLGVKVYVDAKLRTSRRFDVASLLASDPRYETMLCYWTPQLCLEHPETFDLVLTLGGDGTVLYTSWLFQQIVPSILSFSLGSLGFLTNFSFPSYKPTLDRIIEGSGMRVNMRMRFTCSIYRSASTYHSSKSLGPGTTTTTEAKPPPPDLIFDSSHEVLNELVLDRGPSPYVSNLELYGDNHLLTIIQADGCIISTPTGSTAYSLSAGGPLTHPSIPGILLTPICPHTLSFRPMVLSDTLMLRLVVPRNSRSTAYASFDGKGRVELRRGDEVRVEAGKFPFPTVVGEGGTEGEWFESVRRALRWNIRGVVQGRGGSDGIDEAGRGEWGEGGGVGRGGAGVEGDAEEDYGEDEDGEWDIDAEPIGAIGDGGSAAGSASAESAIDSAIGASEAGSSRGSPAPFSVRKGGGGAGGWVLG